MKNQRYENIDLLRLISIWFVICIHYVGWGGISDTADIPMLNLAFSGGIAVACNCAVNCFYMISGFFIREKENILVVKKRILKVWVPTLIYSVCIPLILVLVGAINLDIKQFILLFFPVIGNQYWFATVFVVMAALLPYLAKVLKESEDKEIIILIIILIFIDVIQPLGG